MEKIVLPNFIPAKESELYGDALLANHTGKQLAAVFYMRAFIEQFARRQTGISGVATGEEIMDAYSASLPPTLRDMMPSLKEWYGKLSGPMHAADEKSARELFDDARYAINDHFDIRRAHKLKDATPSSSSNSTVSPPASAKTE